MPRPQRLARRRLPMQKGGCEEFSLHTPRRSSASQLHRPVRRDAYLRPASPASRHLSNWLHPWRCAARSLRVIPPWRSRLIAPQMPRYRLLRDCNGDTKATVNIKMLHAISPVTSASSGGRAVIDHAIHTQSGNAIAKPDQRGTLTSSPQCGHFVPWVVLAAITLAKEKHCSPQLGQTCCISSFSRKSVPTHLESML